MLTLFDCFGLKVEEEGAEKRPGSSWAWIKVYSLIKWKSLIYSQSQMAFGFRQNKAY